MLRKSTVQLCILSAFLTAVICPSIVLALDDQVPIRMVTILKIDDQGLPINIPTDVFYDYTTKETYVVSSTGRITIYGDDYFPEISLGQGRNITNPSGIFVDKKGSIYLCQGTGQVGSSVKNPKNRPRITILNAAFFLEKEIFFDQIPEVLSFNPSRVAVNQQGNIYICGILLAKQENTKGVLVLDPNGKFLNWITPTDIVYRAPKAEKASEPKAPTPEANITPEDQTAQEIAAELANLPAEFLPTAKESDQPLGIKEQKLPVFVNDVVIDQKGRIYLLSTETSRIYVYNDKHEFLLAFGEKGGATGKLSTPLALGIDEVHQAIYVVDYMRHTIICYDYLTGKYIFEFGGQGSGPLWFNYPNNIAVGQKGNVIVADLFNRRVQVIDPNMGTRRPVLSPALPQVSEISPPEEPLAETALVPTVANTEAAQITAVSPPTPAKPVKPPHLAGPVLTQIKFIAESTELPGEIIKIGPKQIEPPKKKMTLLTPPLVNPPQVIVAVPEIGATITFPAGKSGYLTLLASLGVYGPVAALGLLGGWFLYHNN